MVLVNSSEEQNSRKVIILEPLNFFMSPEHIEPTCQGCQNKIDYGVTTRFDDILESHVCLSCGNTL